MSTPILADLHGDGVLYCLFGSQDRHLYVLSVRDSTTLWSYRTDARAFAGPEMADLNSDGVADCVVASDDHNVYLLSGRDGSCVWKHDTGGQARISLRLSDLDGDRVPDCVASSGTKLLALSGKTGKRIWDQRLTADAPSDFRDLNDDGVADCIVDSSDGSVLALSGKDGSCLWSLTGGAAISCTSTLSDLNGDGIPDIVVARRDHSLAALSGADRAVLWESSMDLAPASAAPSCEAECLTLEDITGDGIADCIAREVAGRTLILSGRDGSVVGSRGSLLSIGCPSYLDLDADGRLDVVDTDLDESKEPCVLAQSGRNGSVLWHRRISDWLSIKSRLVDLDGDGFLDIVVGGGDGRIEILSTRDGALLWSYERSGEWPSSVSVADLNGDALLDLVIVWRNEVQAIAGRRVRANLQRLGDRRENGSWQTLRNEAAACLKESRDRQTTATCLLHFGLAQLHLGDPEAARGAFAEARSAGLRAPDGAVFEWLASWRWKGCPKELRAESRETLRSALESKPHTVFDGFCEVRDILTVEAVEQIPALVEGSVSDDMLMGSALIVAILGSRPDVGSEVRAGVSTAMNEVFPMVEQAILRKIRSADPNLGRWYGYLALLADLQGDAERFGRAYALYLTVPGRRHSLDNLLAEVARRAGEREAAKQPGLMPDWMQVANRGFQAARRWDWSAARPLLEEALSRAALDASASAPMFSPLIQLCHSELARIYCQASVGRDSRDGSPREVDAGEAKRLRDIAFDHLESALDGGGAVADDLAQRLPADFDFAPLHDDPRWKELLDRLGR